jgi:acyl-CoA thioester hydrolase
MPFERILAVSWMHLDANGHMANTSYIAMAIDVRFMYYASQGLTPGEFARMRIGPVVRRDEVDYYREFHMFDKVRITLTLAGVADDASRFRIRNELYREDGQLAARITSLGGWFDLDARKLIAPPEKLANALRAIEKAEDFEVLKSSVRSAAPSGP